MSKLKTKTFPTQDLMDILWDNLPDGSPYKKLDIVAGSEGRWTINYELIFSFNGVTYSADYESGTGDSGVTPFEHNEDTTECTEMEIVPVVRNIYIPVKL